MTWHLAPCLATLRNQVDAIAPGRKGIVRNKAGVIIGYDHDDGTISSAEHQARDKRLGIKSDHDVDENGFVCALDLTHDPHPGGLNSYNLADLLRGKHDKRIAYLISNNRIWNPSVSNAWRFYGGGGKDPHTGHLHISVSHTPALRDDSSLWDLRLVPGPTPAPAPPSTDFTASGKASWYSQYRGKYIWVDKGDGKWNASRTIYLGPDNALGVPDAQQGIAFFNRATLGKWFWVKAPNGVILRLRQSDVGPAPRTGRKIDIAAVAAEAFGYSPHTFPTNGTFLWRAA